jgi:TolB-like protein
LAPETGDRTSQPVDPVTPPKHKKHRLVLLVCALFALGLVAWAVQRYFRAKAAISPIHSIAVLPLANLSGDPSEEFFADGMTDQLITDLAKVGSLRVVSRTSVMQYKGGRKSLPEIARELNVDAIVEGSITRSGQRVRVQAQLVQARTDHHLWAETYDRDLGDILKLQDEVARSIAQQVRAQLSPTQQNQLRSARPVNAAAYDAYLRGRLYFVNEFTNPDSLKKAQHYFEESIQKDPNFALAYAGLADAYVYQAFAGVLPRDQADRLARQYLAKALELDDSIGEAYDTLGVLSWYFDWDWDTADREFNRAIALAPSYSCALEDRANFLANIGRRAEALAEIAKVDQLDSASSGARTESKAYFDLRDYPRLIEASKRALLLDPKDWSQHYKLGAGYEGTGKLQEAIPEYQKAIEMAGSSLGPTVALAHAYAAAGRKAEATQILRDLERKAKETSAPSYTMATIYAGLGENDRAFEFLEKAYAEKSFAIPESLKSDFLLDSLRPDPRFQNLLQRVGLTG